MNKSFEDAYSLNKIIPVYRVHVVCDVCYMSHLVERCVWTSFRPPRGFLSTVTTVTLTRRRQAIQSQDTAFPHERASVMNAVGLVMDIMHCFIQWDSVFLCSRSSCFVSRWWFKHPAQGHW